MLFTFPGGLFCQQSTRILVLTLLFGWIDTSRVPVKAGRLLLVPGVVCDIFSDLIFVFV